MSSGKSDFEPLDVSALRTALVRPNGGYAALDVVERTGSTNVDLLAAARSGAADRTVLIAEAQTAGQGRRSRGWVSPPGAGLYLSVLLRPAGVPVSRLPWLTLLAGVALARTAESVGVDAALKWPNDLLLGRPRRKAAGVLAEISTADGPAVVLGIGLNVHPLPAGVPLGAGGLAPTSLADENASDIDRTVLAVRLLAELATWEGAWRQHSGDPVAAGLRDEYQPRCETLGQRIRVELPGSAELSGRAVGLGDDGTLLLRADDGVEHALSAGDVVHVRGAESR
ncbi:MAG TPA: biotin--[acetyl-CoA-carboxylase] ligase [Pseudonocardiaceae bacterium]|nr:biotin--[acetyl-CoA-carboxylase] ligase [Pseudonocardiaceae bacterium]